MDKLMAAFKKIKKLSTVSGVLFLYLFLDAALRSVEISPWLTVWIMTLLTVVIVGIFVILLRIF